MLEEKIYDLSKEKIERIGYELVRVKYFDKTKTLQIMIDSKEENTKITMKDCTAVSREMSVILDVEDVISKEYTLEISSPGIDRPLVRLGDFEKHKGQRTKLLLKEAIDGIKKYKATIKELKKEMILFELEDSKIIEIPFENIQAANLLASEII
jgi:ribosome maturation factor RimP